MTGYKYRFVKNEYRESAEYLHNPDCGWYHIYTIYLQNDIDKDAINASIADETLALLFVNIGRYRNDILHEDELMRLEEAINVFVSKGMHLIIRVAYDNAGLGMNREPSHINTVREHMKSLGSIFCRYSEYILTLQGLFVGSWGEMHSSKYLKDDGMLRELAGNMYNALEGKCCIAVRRPDQYRALKGVIPVSRLALFNDAIGASETDMNTYGQDKNAYAGCTEEEIRETELRWQYDNVGNVPNGGEVLLGEGHTPGREAVKDLYRMHVTYLNSAYDMAQLDEWKKEIYTGKDVYNGLSVYDYIGTHMGYRFVVRDAKLTRKCILCVDIENVGFASMYKEAECAVCLDSDTCDTIRVIFDYDIRNIKSHEKKRLKIDISGYLESSKAYNVYISMALKEGGQPIRFANYNINDRMFLGKIY